MEGLGARDILLLDGATGTELDRRGVDVSLPIWSARALIDAPEVVEQIHREYLRAGADAIITNTFRAHRRSLQKAGLGKRAKELTRLAVEIAQRARDRENPEALVLGSVAPLEDCYQPQLSPSRTECRDEHREMIAHLLEAGVDRILLETMNTRHEALAAAEVAQELAAGKWMISFCTKSQGPPGIMLHGAPLVDVLPSLRGASAVGVNCVSADSLTPQVRLLRHMLPPEVQVMAYGNIGHAEPDGEWVNSDAIHPARYADYAMEWIDAGAMIVGGCCGTTPETIRAIANRLSI